MGNIVDGIQRPLRVNVLSFCYVKWVDRLVSQFKNSPNPFTFPVVSTRMPSIDLSNGISNQHHSKCVTFTFHPALLPKYMKVGDHISGGDIFGSVYENSLVDNHKVMLSPRALGTITHIAEKESYGVAVRSVLRICNPCSL
jgi:hypothetical protein